MGGFGRKRNGGRNPIGSKKLPKPTLCPQDKMFVGAADGHKVSGYLLLHKDMVGTRMVFWESIYMQNSLTQGLLMKTANGTSDSICTHGT